MADEATVNIGENTPEYVAYRLFRDIAAVEEKAKGPRYPITTAVDRKWILDTYAECLTAARGHREI